ncbi:RNA 2',3'-cyclic phosphodiesterase [Oxalobacter sp. OttesenSCG-928-P03]|nr:RNA 2',3'-cyclic phosphodiesterase [Oxalobacter sp. OttesenSCG-928-P03]
MSKRLRLFYALWPDEATRKALTSWQSTLSGRKVPPENLHITLAFLGEQPADLVPELSKILASLSSDKIELLIDRTGYFPHNRINWAGTAKTPPALLQLQKTLIAALSEKHISFDKRNRFKPHITLGRQSDRMKSIDRPPIIWQADHLVLVESRFRQDEKGMHPQYIPIAEHWLGNRQSAQ